MLLKISLLEVNRKYQPVRSAILRLYCSRLLNLNVNNAP